MAQFIQGPTGEFSDTQVRSIYLHYPLGKHDHAKQDRRRSLHAYGVVKIIKLVVLHVLLQLNRRIDESIELLC